MAMCTNSIHPNVIIFATVRKFILVTSEVKWQQRYKCNIGKSGGKNPITLTIFKYTCIERNVHVKTQRLVSLQDFKIKAVLIIFN